jgi:hypothetical protein
MLPYRLDGKNPHHEGHNGTQRKEKTVLPSCALVSVVVKKQNQTLSRYLQAFYPVGGDMSNNISRFRTPGNVGFFIGQAMLLLSFPIEILAAFIKLPSFAEAQANEGLILALCANIPFVIACEIVAWAAFVKKKTFRMIVATIAPLLAMAVLVYLAVYTV